MPFTSTLGSSQVFEGTMLQVGTAGSAGSFVTIANVEDLNIPIKSDKVDVTNVGDHWHRRRPTLNDMGNITFKVFYIMLEPTHDNVSGGLIFMLDNQVLADWLVTFSNMGATTYAFPAYVTSFSISSKTGDVWHAATELSNDGAPTLG